MDRLKHTNSGWSSFVKIGQADLYTRNGGLYGAASEAKSIKVPVKKKDNETDIQDYWTYRRRKGDEFLY